MKLSKMKPASWCWIGLATTVSIMDYTLIYNNKATLSEAFGSALHHPKRKWPVILSWTILTLHLFACLGPEWMDWIKKLDPFSIVARVLRDM